jgi:hypothetical protein
MHTTALHKVYRSNDDMTVPINRHIKGSLALMPGGKNRTTPRKVYRSSDDMTVPINRHIKGSLALPQRGKNR